MLLNAHHPLFVALQETKLLSHHLIHLNHFFIYRYDHQSSTIAHGGVMLAVHTSVPCRGLQLDTHL